MGNKVTSTNGHTLERKSDGWYVDGVRYNSEVEAKYVFRNLANPKRYPHSPTGSVR